jgi:molybdenum cofactor biosynthesis enzyme MoaA
MEAELDMTVCSAPWYELNISAPDGGNTSACCYYQGLRDEWLDGPEDIGRYWNGPGIREVRRVQKGEVPAPNGCSSCHYFLQTLPGQGYYDFGRMPPGLSPAQAGNWSLAKSEYEAKVEKVTCTPLRLYVNFGYTCNLSCTMCYQVPLRGEVKRQVLADTVLSWHETLESCLEFCVIGGEPFAMPEAVRFIRTFIPDPRYETVRLSIFTNGTVTHKHWQTLERKRLLAICTSLDSIGEGYEKIRVGGDWATVERNILAAAEMKAKHRPDWLVTTSANMQRTGFPYLPQFAAWHVKHGILTNFYDFASFQGIEDTYYKDNVLHNPQLLDQIPRWRDSIDEAAGIFRSAGRVTEAAQLEQYRDRVAANAEAKAEYISSMRRRRNRNDWQSIAAGDGSRNWKAELVPGTEPGKSPVPTVEREGLTGFAKTRQGDHFATRLRWIVAPPGGGKFRVRAHWPKGVPADPYTRLAHVEVQDQDGSLLTDFREYIDLGFGTELVLTGDIPDGVRALRTVLRPQGEEVTFLPSTLEFDLDPDTALLDGTGEAPPQPEEPPAEERRRMPSWVMRGMELLRGRRE